MSQEPRSAYHLHVYLHQRNLRAQITRIFICRKENAGAAAFFGPAECAKPPLTYLTHAPPFPPHPPSHHLSIFEALHGKGS
eukprot:1616900-Pyramimonas_sp.AAC.2